MPDSIKLKEELGRDLHIARSYLDKADSNGKFASAEDETAYERAMSAYDEKKAAYERAVKLEEAEAFAGGDNARDLPGKVNKPGLEQPETRSAGQIECDEYQARNLTADYGSVKYDFAPGTEQHKLDHPDYHAKFRSFLLGDIEYRALSTGSAHTFNGSSLKAPASFSADVIRGVANMNVIRDLSKVVTINNGEALEWPKRSAAANNFAFRDESTTAITDDTALAYGNETLYANRLDGVIAVSRRLMRIGGGVNIEALVRDEAIEAISDEEEAKFLTGTGASNQPLGVFTASASGIAAARDISTGNTTTAIGADNLIEVFYGVKSAYRKRGSWVMHGDAIKSVRKLKDANDQYLWQAGLAADRPDTIMGRPVYESDQAPNTFTTGLYVGIFGDFSHYVIRDSLNLEVERLTDSAYAKKNQTGFMVRREVDAKPMLGEAFARMTLA